MSAMPHTYDLSFMEYTAQSSRHSAKAIVALLHALLPAASVLDVGCARGTWLDEWRTAGSRQIFGVDGDYVDTKHLLIPTECFRAADLTQPITLGRRFDLVQSLEVAEHLPASAADGFVRNLVDHASGAILFSAAPPGQGGEFHINEQPYDYWREKFRRHGYAPYDCVRPAIAHDKSISFWYRYNVLLYLTQEYASTLPESVQATRIPEALPVPDTSPFAFRVRKIVIGVLPLRMQLSLARAKAWLGVRLMRRRSRATGTTQS